MPPFFAHSILIGLVVMTERRKSSSWQAKVKDPIRNRSREESGGTPWSLTPPPPWTFGQGPLMRATLWLLVWSLPFDVSFPL